MADVWGGCLLAAYGAAGGLLRPFVPLALRFRARAGREDLSRRAERYGRPSKPRPDGGVIWVHAASVGETNAVMPLVRHLTESGWNVVLTTITVTSAEVAARTLPRGAVHQYAPIDLQPWVARFLAYWRPALAIFVESEVWPVMTDRLAKAGIAHVIVNGRLSEHARRRWRRFGTASRRIFGRITVALAQTEADRDRLKALGAGAVQVLGNLKFDAPPPPAAETALAGLRLALAGRPCWLAASTHPGEEEAVAEAHRALLRDYPSLVTIIVPRHPGRGPALAAMLGGAGEAAWLRSRGDPMPPGPGVLIADTVGEMGLFYRLAPVSFVGGSLVARGGQNPIEAVRLRSAVLHGPGVDNFAEVYDALDRAGGAVRVETAAFLAAAAGRLLGDEPTRLRQLVSAETALRPFSGALHRTIAALEPLLRAARESPW